MIHRDIIDQLQESSKFFSAIAILGPRQSGKTTLAQYVFPQHSYVSLEDFDKRLQATDDPRSFLAQYSNDHGIILDKIQHAPHLLSYIQTIIDKEKKKGYFIITGSQNILVNEAVTQTLAGRIAIMTLFPLSIHELQQANLLNNTIEEFVFKGMYPRIYDEQIPSEKLYYNYIRSYIERDVREIKNILDLGLFQRFLQLCAGRIGQELNYSSLANDCGIDHKTAKAWISLLEATYIIFLLPPYYRNISKTLTKSPKLYFVDTGIACSLLNIKSPNDLYSHFARGGIIESFFVADFFKQFYNLDKKPTLYFWRDLQGNEVDCVLEKSLSLIPIEIKAGQTVSKDYFKQFDYWQEHVGGSPKTNFVVYTGKESAQWSKGNVVGWQDSGHLITDLIK